MNRSLSVGDQDLEGRRNIIRLGFLGMAGFALAGCGRIINPSQPIAVPLNTEIRHFDNSTFIIASKTVRMMDLQDPKINRWYHTEEKEFEIIPKNQQNMSSVKVTSNIFLPGQDLRPEMVNNCAAVTLADLFHIPVQEIGWIQDTDIITTLVSDGYLEPTDELKPGNIVTIFGEDGHVIHVAPIEEDGRLLSDDGWNSVTRLQTLEQVKETYKKYTVAIKKYKPTFVIDIPQSKK